MTIRAALIEGSQLEATVSGPVLLSEGFDWRWLVYGALSLTVVRMLPVALALPGTHERWPTVASMGWFGPRGLASDVFLMSIILHRLSAKPLAVAYGAWAGAQPR